MQQTCEHQPLHTTESGAATDHCRTADDVATASDSFCMHGSATSELLMQHNVRDPCPETLQLSHLSCSDLIKCA